MVQFHSRFAFPLTAPPFPPPELRCQYFPFSKAKKPLGSLNCSRMPRGRREGRSTAEGFPHDLEKNLLHMCSEVQASFHPIGLSNPIPDLPFSLFFQGHCKAKIPPFLRPFSVSGFQVFSLPSPLNSFSSVFLPRIFCRKGKKKKDGEGLSGRRKGGSVTFTNFAQ